MSKRNYSSEKLDTINRCITNNTTNNGSVIEHPDIEFIDMMDKLVKYGVYEGHHTLLSFISVSFIVENLHRAGQDDWDSHSRRYDNRIIRESTRLAKFSDTEKSDWYKDKILYPFEALELSNIQIPNEVFKDNVKYVRTDFGYIREDLIDNKDAKRGLYPEAIPSKFIFSCRYNELCHVIQHRDKDSNANPEVKEVAESIKVELTKANKWLGENLTIMKVEGAIK